MDTKSNDQLAQDAEVQDKNPEPGSKPPAQTKPQTKPAPDPEPAEPKGAKSSHVGSATQTFAPQRDRYGLEIAQDGLPVNGAARAAVLREIGPGADITADMIEKAKEKLYG